MSAQLLPQQSLCLQKTEMNLTRGHLIFFSFCDVVSQEVSFSAPFLGKLRVLQVAMRTLDAISECSDRVRRMMEIAAKSLHWRFVRGHLWFVNVRPPAAESSRDRDQRDRYPQRSRSAKVGARPYLRTKNMLFGVSLVERRWCVCYFLKARGVAQLGSAPALGAGGRPFKSARPDTRQ